MLQSKQSLEGGNLSFRVENTTPCLVHIHVKPGTVVKDILLGHQHFRVKVVFQKICILVQNLVWYEAVKVAWMD